MFVNTGINSLIRDYRYIIIIVYQHQQPGGGFVVMSGRLRFTHHVITERRVNTSTDETRVEPQPSEKHSMQITGVACDHVTFAKKNSSAYAAAIASLVIDALSSCETSCQSFNRDEHFSFFSVKNGDSRSQHKRRTSGGNRYLES